MKRFNKNFLIGAATSAHQVEGDNKYSDFWEMEQMKHSIFQEPSLKAADHYHHYKEDIELLSESGLNAYRFSIEWARIEPKKGVFDEKEMNHYNDVIDYCINRKIEPVVTLHHFSSPKWLIEEGGWEAETTVEYFASYCRYVVKHVGEKLNYICTINEANMGLQMASIMRDRLKQTNSGVQVGVRLVEKKEIKENMKELLENFGITPPEEVNHFLSMRSEKGDCLIMRAHEAARDTMKNIYPHLKIGITLSLHDFQFCGKGEKLVEKEWEEEFGHYIPYILKDDFLGLQNYTRKLVGTEGVQPVSAMEELTQMNYEFYPEALANVIRKVAGEIPIPIMITENGVATEDDQRRIEFIRRALAGVTDCVKDGIPVIGYMYWSLLDNFEWMMGFTKEFGLIAVDRKTQKRYPKESLSFLGGYAYNEERTEL